MTSPRYLQLAADLRDRIALGEPGEVGALESEAALGARHGVSRATVRRALVHLRDQGLVESRHGAGWFVSGASFSQPLALGTFRHASSAVSAAGGHARRTVVDFGWAPAPGPTAALFGVADGTRLLHSTSVRDVDSTPLDVVREWVADDAAGRLSRDDAADPGIWQSLERSGSRVESVRQTITAAVAAGDDATLLSVADGSPLLLVRRVAHRPDGRPLALADHRYLAHRFSLEVEFRGWRSAGADAPPGLRAI